MTYYGLLRGKTNLQQTCSSCDRMITATMLEKVPQYDCNFVSRRSSSSVLLAAKFPVPVKVICYPSTSSSKKEFKLLHMAHSAGRRHPSLPPMIISSCCVQARHSDWNPCSCGVQWRDICWGGQVHLEPLLPWPEHHSRYDLMSWPFDMADLLPAASLIRTRSPGERDVKGLALLFVVAVVIDGGDVLEQRR